MTRLILVRAAQTDWGAQGRLAGDTDLPLNETGHCEAVADGQELAEAAPAAVLSGPEEATRQTGTLIAHEVRQKLRPWKNLREMDLGHWEGLTEAEFRERFGKVYRQWRNDPLAVTPPEGESVVRASRRLSTAVLKIVKDHADKTVVLVLGRFAGAIVRCELAGAEYTPFWTYVDGDRCRTVVEMTDGQPAVEVESAAASPGVRTKADPHDSATGNGRP
ncbi:MAG: histidine phosphatase family protein [Phycisphaerae bacterium]